MALQGFMDFAGLSPQLDTLQLPKQTNLTLQKTSDSSFSQILSSFYKDDASFKKDESVSSEKKSLSASENPAKADNAEKQKISLLKIRTIRFQKKLKRLK